MRVAASSSAYSAAMPAATEKLSAAGRSAAYSTPHASAGSSRQASSCVHGGNDRCCQAPVLLSS